MHRDRDEVLIERQERRARDLRLEREQQAAGRGLPHVAAAPLALALDVRDADHPFRAALQSVVEKLLRARSAGASNVRATHQTNAAPRSWPFSRWCMTSSPCSRCGGR